MRDEDEIELVLKPGTSPEELSGISTAITTWCMWATSFSMIRPMRLTIKGGPYLTREETIAVFRHFLPDDLVEDVMVEGRSWSEGDSDMPVDVTSAEADTVDDTTGKDRVHA